MSPTELLSLGVAALGALNTIGLFYLAFRKAPVERAALDAVADKTTADSAAVWLANYNTMFQQGVERDDAIRKLRNELHSLSDAFEALKRSSTRTIDELTAELSAERQLRAQTEETLVRVRKERDTLIEQMESRVSSLEAQVST